MNFKQTRLDGSGRRDYSVARGRDFNEPIVVQELDLTGDTFSGRLVLFPDAGDAIASFSVSAPTLLDGDTRFTLSISDDVLASLAIPASTAGDDVELFYDVERISGGLKSTFLHGKFIINGKA